MSIDDASSKNATLSRLLDEACQGRLSDLEFIAQARQSGVSSDWMQSQLEAIHTQWNETRLYLLVDCLYLPHHLETPEWGHIASTLCRMMLDPRMTPGMVELTADGLGMFALGLEDLRLLAQVCTLDHWDAEGHWPDLRKVLESMLIAVRHGSVACQDVLNLLDSVANHPATQNEDCGLRAAANAMHRHLATSAK